MRYTITSQQFDHFRNEGRIEYQDLFSEEEIKALKLFLEDARKGNATGRDLQRENLPLQKAMRFSRLGQAANGLLGKDRLQLAFTQYPLPYKELATLEEISSVTKTLCCILIDLQNSEEIIFYNQSTPIEFPNDGLLIALSSEHPRYKLQVNDPHTHILKKLGYGFGDRLTPETHPIVSK